MNSRIDLHHGRRRRARRARHRYRRRHGGVARDRSRRRDDAACRGPPQAQVRRAPPLGGCRGPPQAQVRRAPPLGGQLGAHARLRGGSPSPSPLTVHLRGEARRGFSPLRASSTLKHLHTTRVGGVRDRDESGGTSPPILLLYVTSVGRTHVAREWPKHRKSALDFVEHDQMG